MVRAPGDALVHLASPDVLASVPHFISTQIREPRTHLPTRLPGCPSTCLPTYLCAGLATRFAFNRGRGAAGWGRRRPKRSPKRR